MLRMCMQQMQSRSAQRDIFHQIQKWKKNPAFGAYLTRILISTRVNQRVREAAGALLKLSVNGSEQDITEHWTLDIQRFVMQQILHALADPSPFITRIVAQCVSFITCRYGLRSWSVDGKADLCQGLLQFLQSKDPLEVQGALHAMIGIVLDCPQELDDPELCNIQQVLVALRPLIAYPKEHFGDVNEHLVSIRSLAMELLVEVTSNVSQFLEKEHKSKHETTSTVHAFQEYAHQLLGGVYTFAEALANEPKGTYPPNATVDVLRFFRMFTKYHFIQHLAPQLEQVAQFAFHFVEVPTAEQRQSDDKSSEKITMAALDWFVKAVVECEPPQHIASGPLRTVFSVLFPKLQSLMEITSEDDVREDFSEDRVQPWTLRSAASAVIEEFSLCFGDSLLEQFLYAVQDAFNSPTIARREIGVRIIGLIAKGCETGLANHLQQTLIEYMLPLDQQLDKGAPPGTPETEKILLRSSICWTLGRCQRWLFAQPRESWQVVLTFLTDRMLPTRHAQIRRSATRAVMRVIDRGTQQFVQNCFGSICKFVVEKIIQDPRVSVKALVGSSTVSLCEALIARFDTVGTPFHALGPNSPPIDPNALTEYDLCIVMIFTSVCMKWVTLQPDEALNSPICKMLGRCLTCLGAPRLADPDLQNGMKNMMQRCLSAIEAYTKELEKRRSNRTQLPDFDVTKHYVDLFIDLLPCVPPAVQRESAMTFLGHVGILLDDPAPSIVGRSFEALYVVVQHNSVNLSHKNLVQTLLQYCQNAYRQTNHKVQEIAQRVEGSVKASAPAGTW
eukprot:NODE_144_length_2628_cov_402.742536_g117_i0.p2 GENE.NODE_144_length_2628_cov_402.742536_g117_i0~~NODE_144_length_2628_cov_402.742536_g117_i0.p2  ORF type:complete len:826 (+),score=248.93 NODE_144_length_2628_cov_402.742536_g117_i0:120-2480(+)